jgi:hypothetical protein
LPVPDRKWLPDHSLCTRGDLPPQLLSPSHHLIRRRITRAMPRISLPARVFSRARLTLSHPTRLLLRLWLLLLSLLLLRGIENERTLEAESRRSKVGLISHLIREPLTARSARFGVSSPDAHRRCRRRRRHRPPTFVSHRGSVESVLLDDTERVVDRGRGGDFESGNSGRGRGRGGGRVRSWSSADFWLGCECAKWVARELGGGRGRYRGVGPGRKVRRRAGKSNVE